MLLEVLRGHELGVEVALVAGKGKGIWDALIEV